LVLGKRRDQPPRQAAVPCQWASSCSGVRAMAVGATAVDTAHLREWGVASVYLRRRPS
jgi:hypothetical protein